MTNVEPQVEAISTIEVSMASRQLGHAYYVPHSGKWFIRTPGDHFADPRPFASPTEAIVGLIESTRKRLNAEIGINERTKAGAEMAIHHLENQLDALARFTEEDARCLVDTSQSSPVGEATLTDLTSTPFLTRNNPT